MKRVLLCATGGTISMLVDRALDAAVPTLWGAELLGRVPGVEGIARVDVREVALVGGSQITPSLIFELSREVDRALSEGGYDGAVVTQGTDTVEEASYMLDLLIRTEKPVVHTVAMRNNSELGADGPRNLLAAIRTAASNEAMGKGVLVVANDEIYAAVDVVKMNTLNTATLKAPGRGPLGYVMSERVVFFHSSIIRQKIPVEKIVTNVPIVKFGFGMDDTLLQAALDAGAEGLVLEGAGAGNFPEVAEAGILKAIQQGIPVVLASRCPEGFIDDIYGYPGAGKRLTSAGAILAQGLGATKARVKLMVVLGKTRDLEEIRRIFEYLY